MKKTFFAILLLFFFCPLFSKSLPEGLYGIWEGKDRYVFFEQEGDDSPEEPVLVILLKEYYGWYLDRAAEPLSYAEKEPRSRNTATPRSAVQVPLDFQPISKAEDLASVSGSAESSSPNGTFAGELVLTYSRFQKSRIALAVTENSLYLNFFIQDTGDKNYYRGNASADGIKLSPSYTDRNIGGLYVTGGKIYDVRYWISGMDYSEEKALVRYGDDSLYVDKHLYSCGNNYSATSGRSNVVRNVVAPKAFSEDDYIFSEDKRLLITDSEPYLVRLADKDGFEQLLQIVREANSRVKPPAEPPFPPSDLDWHWDLIDLLESGNPVIQEVRARQKAFGSRGKDIGR